VKFQNANGLPGSNARLAPHMLLRQHIRGNQAHNLRGKQKMNILGDQLQIFIKMLTSIANFDGDNHGY
jgi:hypothetical protein